MKIFTLLTSLLLFLISTSDVMANTKQQAAQKKLQSYGCKLIQDAQGKSFYKCKPDAPKSLIKYYSQIVQKKILKILKAFIRNIYCTKL